MPDSIQNNPAMPDLNSIGSWSQADYQCLTADFVSKMTPDQIHQMAHTSWMPDAAAAGFTPEMVQKISISMYWFTPGWLNNLSTEALQALTPTQMGQFTANTLCGVDASHLSDFTPAQVAAMGCSFYWFDAKWMNSLSLPAFQAITAQQLTELLGTSLTGVDSQHAGALTVEQISNWKSTFYWFSSGFLNNLSVETFRAISADHLNEVTTANFAQLDNEHIAAISADTFNKLENGYFSALTAQQVTAISDLNALSSAQFGLLNISGLSVSALSSLTQKESSALTAHQLSTLSIEQFTGLNVSGLSLSAISGMSKEVYEKFTPQQVATLSPEQIGAMAHTSWLPDATGTAFKPQQVQSIAISMGYFSVAWLNNLSIEALQALTPKQASQISNATLAGLDNKHLHALTADQIGGMNNFGGLSSAQFGLLDISKLPDSMFNYFSKQEYSGLTAGQISTLSADQINAMWHAAWMPDDAASGFTVEQIQNCTQNFYWFTPGWYNSLSTEAMQGITAEQFTHIEANVFTQWDNQHLAVLTAEQVAHAPHISNLTSDQFGYLDISKLPVSTIEQLSKTEYQGLTAKQVSTLSAEQIQALQHFDWIPAAAAHGFTTAQMAGFGSDLSLLPAVFLNNLDTASFAALTSEQLGTLNPVAFAGLDYQHFWAINDLSALSDLISSLSTDQLLTVSQLMSVEQLAQLPESQNLLISTSVETGTSLVNNMSDPALKVLMHNAMTNDASLFSFQTIESVLKDFASQIIGNLSASQYNDIKNYVQEIGNVCGTDSAIYSLVNGLIGTNGASVYWSATGKGERIGSLNEGSSVAQFNQLITTWFDGANDPKSSSSDHVDGRPVFAKGGPTINDIQQGGVGDCSLLSALQAVVEAAPDFIKSMIVQNPNDTYSVRFFKEGVAHWVTVDGNVDGSGTSSANSSWGAIIERAVVDFEATYLNEVNDYSSLPGGFDKLQEITGDTNTTFRAVYTTEEKWNTTDFDLLKTAVLNGQPVQFSSWESSQNADTGQTNLVGAHAFAIIGFDDVTNDFILTNPWGAFRNDNVQGTFEASMDQMWQGGNYSTGIAIVNSNGTADAAGQLVHAMAAMNTSPSAVLSTAALPVNVNNGSLAASHA